MFFSLNVVAVKIIWIGPKIHYRIRVVGTGAKTKIVQTLNWDNCMKW